MDKTEKMFEIEYVEGVIRLLSEVTGKSTDWLWQQFRAAQKLNNWDSLRTMLDLQAAVLKKVT